MRDLTVRIRACAGRIILARLRWIQVARIFNSTPNPRLLRRRGHRAADSAHSNSATLGATMAPKEIHGKFDDILAFANPEFRPVCESLRRQIALLHQGFVEVVWLNQKTASYGIGPRKMREHYAYVAVYGSHINLGFYHGASLPDPEGLLEGTAKGLRHVKLRDVAAAKDAAIVALLREAIADRKRHAADT
jgi:hypothetical protein